ncbi:MAG: carboxypeptidase regulatory-like domain-containing protein [Vulcanimicrobiota bacterium]
MRWLLGLAVLLMFVPTFLFAAGPLRRPPMFEGDRIQEMECRRCSGAGKEGAEECRLCRGRGRTDYILPGPNRPTQVIGTVLNGGGHPVEGANILVKSSFGELSYRTNGDGQFGVKLPPGRYTIEASQEGAGQAVQEVDVVASVEPLPAAMPTTLAEMAIELSLKP